MNNYYNDVVSTKTEGLKRNINDSLESLERKAEKRGYLKGYEDGFKDGQNAPKVEKVDIKVGDEVTDPNGLKAIVTNTDTHYHLFYPHNGKTWKAPKGIVLTKTGKRFKVTR